jgi:hypothetical protein
MFLTIFLLCVLGFSLISVLIDKAEDKKGGEDDEL